MIDQKPKLILVGAIVVIVLAAISAGIIYLGKSLKNKPQGSSDTSSTNVLSSLPVVPATSNSSVNNSEVTNQPDNLKTFQGEGFNLQYPKQWGLLTCNNSNNFELDPLNSNDTKNVVCDLAIKPVTILVVSRLNCTGDTITLGSNSVIKSKTSDSNGDIQYRWCVSIGGKNLDITHRVSTSLSRATSKDDFSAKLEEIIATLKTGGGS